MNKVVQSKRGGSSCVLSVLSTLSCIIGPAAASYRTQTLHSVLSGLSVNGNKPPAAPLQLLRGHAFTYMYKNIWTFVPRQTGKEEEAELVSSAYTMFRQC